MKNDQNNHNADFSALKNSEFLCDVLASSPAGATLWVNAFIGNPNSTDATWGGAAYGTHLAQQVDAWQRQNSYFSVAAMHRLEDGSLQRRKSHFARLLVLVADDVDPDTLVATPSWGIETSPGKRQVGVLLDADDPDCSDVNLVTRLVTAMASKGLITADKSGNNPVRYVRLPVGQNQKPRETGPFSHVLEYWNPGIRYTLEDAAGVFGVNLEEIRHAELAREPMAGLAEGDQEDKLRTLTQYIMRGENLHDSINGVAASMVASGAKGGAIVNLLRGLMDCSAAAHDSRFQERYNDIPRAVATAQEKFQLRLATPTFIDQETGEVIERPLFSRVSDLIANISPTKWLIENYLEQDALSMLFGPSGGGKSFVVVDMACCIATGTPWHGMPTTKGAVFYIAGEGHNGLAKRFAAWQKSSGISLAGDVPLFKSNRAVMMLNAAAAQAMSDEVDILARDSGHAPAMVIIDTLARNFGDGDENTQKDAGRFIEHMDEYVRRRWNCNVMVVHHSGHEMDRARGSSAFKGAMDQELSVKGSGGKIELTVTKMKDAEIPAGKLFAITQVGLGVIVDGSEINGAYIKVDGNPLMFKVGTKANGADITASDVINEMYPKWPGSLVMQAVLDLNERKLARVMKAMKDNALAEYHNNGPINKTWTLTDKALDAYSISGLKAVKDKQMTTNQSPKRHGD